MKIIGLFLALLVLAACHRPAPPVSKIPQSLAVPTTGAYTGAYIDFGEHEDEVTLEAIENFEELVGKHQAMIAFSSYWGERSFPRENAELVFRHHSIPLIYWSPWDRPYTEGRIPGPFSLPNIVAGKCDAYIDDWGRQARAFGQPLLVAWGIEMNGDWFPWSGSFAGGKKRMTAGTEATLYAGPEMYKQAYRHVVDRVRAQGARNIQWVFHVNNSSSPMEPWNRMANYYPGPAYADWLAMSAYGQQYPGTGWINVPQVFLPFYDELSQIDSTKPIMLAEWGAGEFPHSGNRAAWITEAFTLFQSWPRLKAAIFWHERWQNGDESYSNLRINASAAALDAYRAGVRNPFWLETPQWREDLPPAH
jgi:hypothetical protein